MLKSSRELFRLFDGRALSPYHDEEPSSLLLPDILLPAQYYSTRKTSLYYRLLLAILEDAIRCFQRNCDARTGRIWLLFREAKEWLFDPDATAFTSCPIVCESLGIEPALLRRRLRQWYIAIRHELNERRQMRHPLAPIPMAPPRCLTPQPRCSQIRRCASGRTIRLPPRPPSIVGLLRPGLAGRSLSRRRASGGADNRQDFVDMQQEVGR
jgi:hypothetical protein